MNFSVIKNAATLGATPLRQDALAILEAGYRAIMTKDVMRTEFVVDGQTLRVDGQVFSLTAYERIFFVGIGKCALDAGEVVEEKLGAWLTDGIILDVRGAPLQKLRSHVGTHPFPSHANMEVTESIAELLESLTARDLLIVVVSGGGSALLCLPHDITCETAALIAKTLMEKGASIAELNTVRKHTSDIQGGQFAKKAAPATIVSLIFSDVPGDDISMVASGPTVLDTTTVDDARRILDKYDILKLCNLPACDLTETPKEPEYFEHVHNILLVTNERGLAAMKHEAERRGYAARIEDTALQGEAYEVGKRLVRGAREAKTCKLYGGETTVTLKKEGGKGGRCQEAVLGALTEMPEGIVFIGATSDGWDNTPSAGAVGDAETLTRAHELGLDPEAAHVASAAYAFFEKVGAHIETGRTGANVSDWYFILTS